MAGNNNKLHNSTWYIILQDLHPQICLKLLTTSVSHVVNLISQSNANCCLVYTENLIWYPCPIWTLSCFTVDIIILYCIIYTYLSLHCNCYLCALKCLWICENHIRNMLLNATDPSSYMQHYLKILNFFKKVFHYMFWSVWPSSSVKTLVVWKLLCPFGRIVVWSHVCTGILFGDGLLSLCVACVLL
jgi:hypothetical protein